MTDIPSPRAVTERLHTHDTGLRARAIQLIGEAKSTSITIKLQDAGDGEVRRVSGELQDAGWAVAYGKVGDARVLLLSEPARAADDPRNDPNARITQVAPPPMPTSAQNTPLPTEPRVGDAKPR